MFVLLLDAGRMLPGSPTPHMSRHTLVTRAHGPVTLSVLANGAGSRSTDEVRPEPASGSARLPRENPTTRPPGQAGITYQERLQPRLRMTRREHPVGTRRTDGTETGATVAPAFAAEAAPTVAVRLRRPARGSGRPGRRYADPGQPAGRR